jgi:hypothetical protein
VILLVVARFWSAYWNSITCFFFRAFVVARRRADRLRPTDSADSLEQGFLRRSSGRQAYASARSAPQSMRALRQRARPRRGRSVRGASASGGRSGTSRWCQRPRTALGIDVTTRPTRFTILPALFTSPPASRTGIAQILLGDPPARCGRYRASVAGVETTRGAEADLGG